MFGENEVGVMEKQEEDKCVKKVSVINLKKKSNGVERRKRSSYTWCPQNGKEFMESVEGAS